MPLEGPSFVVPGDATLGTFYPVPALVAAKFPNVVVLAPGMEAVPGYIICKKRTYGACSTGTAMLSQVNDDFFDGDDDKVSLAKYIRSLTVLNGAYVLVLVALVAKIAWP